MREFVVRVENHLIVTTYSEVLQQQQSNHIRPLATAGADAGVEHCVYTSVGSAHKRTGVPHFDNKWRFEETVGGYDVRPVAAYTPFEQLEGDTADGAAVFEFPSMELAKAWYNSPAYRAIIHHRQQGARYIGLLMEGGLPPVEQRMPHTKNRKPHNA